MAHYFSEEQHGALRLHNFTAELRGHSLAFTSGSGVFSKTGIDEGTRLLIERCIINEGWTVLDLGCGYGAVGTAIARAYSGCTVTMTDINKRAIILAEKNIRVNKVRNAKVVQGDGFGKLAGEKFNTILLNPPQTAGKKLCFALIEESSGHLLSKGILQLVARHNKGGSTLQEKMWEVFGNAVSAAKKGSYRVYVSENNNN